MLDLRDLARNFGPGLSPTKGQDLADAGSVCLEEQGHSVGVRLRVEGDASIDSHELRWPPVTERLRLTHADLQEATELGAAGIAILLSAQETGHAVLQRAGINAGVDYWLGDAPGSVRARLEVSGLLRGDRARINARVSQKAAQTARSADSGFPVYVVVVEFSALSARFHEVKR